MPAPVEAADVRAAASSRQTGMERGSIAVFLAVLGVALFALLGLVVDGGRAIAARSGAMDDAAQAARVGAGQLSVDSLRSGQMLLDPSAATRAADEYLHRVGAIGTATIVGQTVVVHVHRTERTVILGLVGVNTMAVSASASAANVHGVTRQD